MQLTRAHIADLLNRLPTTPLESATKETSENLFNHAEDFGAKLGGSAAAFDPEMEDDSGELQTCLGLAGKLLVSSCFATSSLVSQPLAVALAEECAQTKSFPVATVEDDDDPLLLDTLAERETALNDLKEAMQMLQTELTLLSLIPVEAAE